LQLLVVIPAKAGIHSGKKWMPAFADMTLSLKGLKSTKNAPAKNVLLLLTMNHPKISVKIRAIRGKN